MNTPIVRTSRQRNFATATLLIILFTAMLPALRFPLIGSISLTQWGDGKLTLLAIILAGLCLFFSTEIQSFIQPRVKKSISTNMITYIAVGLMALVFMRILYLWYHFTFTGDDLRDNPFSAALSVNMWPTYGLYLTAIGIAFFFACIFYFEKVEKYWALLQKKIQK